MIDATRLCVEGRAEKLHKPLRLLAQEIRVSGGEGVQADYTFHQHGPQLYSGGYGAGFSVDASRWLPADRRRLRLAARPEQKRYSRAPAGRAGWATGRPKRGAGVDAG